LSDLIAKLQKDDIPVKCPTWLQQKMMCQYVHSLQMINGMTNSCPNLDLPTYSDIDSDEDGSDDEDPDPMEVPLPRLQSFDEAISYLGDICDLLEHRGYYKQLEYSLG
jgi:hypothetical protein